MGNLYNYEIRINDTLRKTFENTDARVFSDVKVYASNPWMLRADASIRNFFVNMNFKSGKITKKAYNIHCFCTKLGKYIILTLTNPNHFTPVKNDSNVNFVQFEKGVTMQYHVLF